MGLYIVTKEDLIGDIKDFPIEIVQKMMERQYQQYGKYNVQVFQTSPSTGFVWAETPEDNLFWDQVIRLKNFDLFFKIYPKKEELPLPRRVLVWNIREHHAVERELLHVFPESLGLNYRFVVRYGHYPKEITSYKYMKELPTTNIIEEDK